MCSYMYMFLHTNIYMRVYCLGVHLKAATDAINKLVDESIGLLFF